MQSPAARRTARNTSALRTVTWPLGNGRSRVRATWASKSRSQMSLKVQPAPRIARAPMPNIANRIRLSRDSGCGEAKAIDHQHGNSSSQVPIGLSSRASRA